MTPQQLQFELMKKASFNLFDGERVVGDLQEHPGLWRGAVMDREASEPDSCDLIKLRDIGEGHWNVDTLFILPVPGKEDELFDLAADWFSADMVWIGGKRAARLIGQYDPTNRGMDGCRLVRTSTGSTRRIGRIWAVRCHEFGHT